MNTSHKQLIRNKKKKYIRYKINLQKINRLLVHKTNKHIYAQIVKYENSKTIISASSTEKNIKKQIKNTGNIKTAIIIGKLIAKRAIQKKIIKVAFDRSGFKYHGKIKLLAETARKIGLKF